MKQFDFATQQNEESLIKHSSQFLGEIMSNPIVEKLYEERNNLWEQMKELNDREISENRSLDSAEKEQWDTMNDRMSEIDSRVSELASLEESNKKAEEARAMFESKPVIEDTPEVEKTEEPETPKNNQPNQPLVSHKSVPNEMAITL